MAAGRDLAGDPPAVTWLNYHHLLYFWTTAKEGGVGAAARKLQLAQPTISGQLRELERTLGVELFERSGRRLALTPIGRRVFERADAIFSIGHEILAMVGGGQATFDTRFVVGCTDAVHARVVERLLAPSMRPAADLLVAERRGTHVPLLDELALGTIDLVITDNASIPARIQAYLHVLGESEIAIFAAPALARRLRPGFPGSLDRAPMLLPGESSKLRASTQAWLDGQNLRPRPVGEFDDPMLLETWAQAGRGVFAAPAATASALGASLGVETIGACTGLRERYWAVSREPVIQHPAAVAITTAATSLFGA